MVTEHQQIVARLQQISSDETDRMISEKLYERPKEFFEWVGTTVRKIREIDPDFYGNQVALSSCDRIDRDKEIDRQTIFENLIEYGASLGLKSEVQTDSIRYTTSVVLSMYLEQKGLGCLMKTLLRGKLIAIEGGDSSGKEVQSKKLFLLLKKNHIPVKFIDFPSYNSFFGKLVGRYLRGEFGDAYRVDPFLSALPYALDRFEVRDKIKKWLSQGDIVICNRYVGSNLGFMPAKYPQKLRRKITEWVEELEYKKLGLPIEDLSIFLHVPSEVGQKLTYKKDEKIYMKGLGRGDIHERNLKYLKEVEKQYKWLCKNKKRWIRVGCMKDNINLRPIEEIQSEILSILKRKKILSI